MWGSGKVSEMDLRTALRKKCQVSCMPVLKLEAVCDNFCEFVDHIVDEHGKELVDAINEVSHHENYETALDWSMDETVRYRRQTYSEDVHALGDYFMKAVKQWHDQIDRGEL